MVRDGQFLWKYFSVKINFGYCFFNQLQLVLSVFLQKILSFYGSMYLWTLVLVTCSLFMWSICWISCSNDKTIKKEISLSSSTSNSGKLFQHYCFSAVICWWSKCLLYKISKSNKKVQKFLFLDNSLWFKLSSRDIYFAQVLRVKPFRGNHLEIC